MAQTHQNSSLATKTSRFKASTALVLTLALAVVIIVAVGIFFKVGVSEQETQDRISKDLEMQIGQLNFQAEVFRKQNRMDDAVGCMKKVVELLEKDKSKDRLPLVSAYIALSDTYRSTGRVEWGEPEIKRAKEIILADHLEEDPLTCAVLHREGLYKYIQKDYIAAEEYLQQSVTCSSTMISSLSAETSDDLLWLAHVYLSPGMNKPEKALRCLRQVEEVTNPAERPSHMMAVQKLQGMAYMALKRYAEAEEKLAASEQLVDRISTDPNHPQRVHISKLLEQVRAAKSAH